jgi:hypothetical protein
VGTSRRDRSLCAVMMCLGTRPSSGRSMANRGPIATEAKPAALKRR